jgi:hypothetical protein
VIDPAMQAMCSARTSNFDDNVGKKSDREKKRKDEKKKILRAILFLCYVEFEMEFRLEF